MAVTIKSEREIELMRQAGKYIAMAHAELEKEVKPGMSTYQIDKIGEEIIRSYGCIPTCLGYEGYPASLCISVNDEVVHGIPRERSVIAGNGDIVSLDAGLKLSGIPRLIAARTVGSRRNKQMMQETAHRSDQTDAFLKESGRLKTGMPSLSDISGSHRRLC